MHRTDSIFLMYPTVVLYILYILFQVYALDSEQRAHGTLSNSRLLRHWEVVDEDSLSQPEAAPSFRLPCLLALEIGYDAGGQTHMSS